MYQMMNQVPQVTDGSLFGETIRTSAGNPAHPAPCDGTPTCCCCGKRERLKRVGRQLVSNLSSVIGACADCLMGGRV